MFLTEEHKARFHAAAAELGYSDSGWYACLFVLTADPRWWTRAQKFIDFGSSLLDGRKMVKDGWSRSELFMVSLAVYLYNESSKPDWCVMWESLDGVEYHLAIRAIDVKRRVARGMSLEEWGAGAVAV